MSKNILIKKIQAVGYSELEAKVYLATLENGVSPVSEIANKAGINRVSCYDILKKMMQKGLITSAIIKNTKHFRALSPEVFIEDTQQKAEELQKSLNILQSLQSTENIQTSIRNYEGISGIQKAYKETLSSSTEILNFANSQNIRDHWQSYDEDYVKKRVEKKIFLRGIAPGDDFGKFIQNNDKTSYRQTKLIKKESFEVENEINIFDNKVLITSFFPKPFAILIESSAVANTQRQIFSVLWGLI